MAQTGREGTSRQLGRPNLGPRPRYTPGQEPRQYAQSVGSYELEAELQRRGIGKLSPQQQAAVRADAMRRHQANPQMQRIVKPPKGAPRQTRVIDWNDY